MPSVIRSIAPRLAAAIAICTAVVAGPANAQGTNEDTYVFLYTAAERGLECDLLNQWQAALLHAENNRALERITDDRTQLTEQAIAAAATTPCDDPAMNEWLDAARPGFAQEWLPPYLALYRALALLDAPPAEFVAIAGDIDQAEAVAAIDAEIAALTNRGIRAEGGGTLEDFVDEVEGIALDIVAAAAGDADAGFTQAEATAFITEAATIVGLWLQTEE